MALADQTLADIVLADSRAAAVFDRLELDYCCRGHQTLAEAAERLGLHVDAVLGQLDALGPVEAGDRVEDWPALDALTAHVVSRHHAYVRETAPIVIRWLDKLVDRHGARHPELRDVQATFLRIVDELSTHMLKEENILFPFIDALARAARNGRRLPAGPFGTILNPIKMMEADHEDAAADLAHLRRVTNGYAPPADGCTTFRACYGELARFEADLHRHVHLENHVLFPRAIALEAELA